MLQKSIITLTLIGTHLIFANEITPNSSNNFTEEEIQKEIESQNTPFIEDSNTIEEPKLVLPLSFEDSNYKLDNPALDFNSEELKRYTKFTYDFKSYWEENKKVYIKLLGDMSERKTENFLLTLNNIDQLIDVNEDTFKRLFFLVDSIYFTSHFDDKLKSYSKIIPLYKEIVLLKSIRPNLANNFTEEDIIEDILFDFERLFAALNKVIADQTKYLSSEEEKWDQTMIIFEDFMNRIIDNFEKPLIDYDKNMVLNKIILNIENNNNLEKEDKENILFKIKVLRQFLVNIRPWTKQIIPHSLDD